VPLDRGPASSGTYLSGFGQRMLKMLLLLHEAVKVGHRLGDARVFLEGFTSFFQSFTVLERPLDPVLE
jgi:hypothetical protein